MKTNLQATEAVGRFQAEDAEVFAIIAQPDTFGNMMPFINMVGKRIAKMRRINQRRRKKQDDENKNFFAFAHLPRNKNLIYILNDYWPFVHLNRGWGA